MWKNMKLGAAGIILTLILGALLAPYPSSGQSPTKVARIGWLTGSGNISGNFVQPFMDGLRDLGYLEGKDVTIEYRSAGGVMERLPALASELVNLNVDVIVVSSTAAALAAKQATSTVPVVFHVYADPVEVGLVKSLQHPGGNMTGLYVLSTDLSAKRLELLKEAFPAVSRVAVLLYPNYVLSELQLKETERAAKALGVELFPIGVERPEDIEAALVTIDSLRADAILVFETPVTFTHRKRVVDVVAKTRLPAMYGMIPFVEDGGLMSYGNDLHDSYRRAAIFVDKILKGAKPGDLPIEQPTKVELLINLRTAKSLSVTIPPSLLVRADKVIE